MDISSKEALTEANSIGLLSPTGDLISWGCGYGAPVPSGCSAFRYFECGASLYADKAHADHMPSPPLPHRILITWIKLLKATGTQAVVKSGLCMIAAGSLYLTFHAPHPVQCPPLIGRVTLDDSLLLPIHHQCDQGWGDLIQWQYKVHASRRDSCTGHAEELGRLLILGDQRPPHLLNGPYPHVAIAAGAGEYHGDDPLPMAGSHRFKEQVGGGADKVHQF